MKHRKRNLQKRKVNMLLKQTDCKFIYIYVIDDRKCGAIITSGSGAESTGKNLILSNSGTYGIKLLFAFFNIKL